MPPLGFDAYEKKKVIDDPFIRRAQLKEQQAVRAAQNVMGAMAGSMSKLRYGLRIAGKKGVDTPRAYYAADTNEEKKRVAAWLHDGGDGYYVLNWQLEEEREGEWHAADETDMTSRWVAVPRESGSLDPEGTFDNLIPAERLHFVTDIDETILLIHEATEANLGVKIPLA